MHYKITKQFPHQAETDCARFNDVNDAKFALNALFARDYQQKTNVVYSLYDKYSDVIVRLDTKKDTPTESAETAQPSESAGASGASSTSGFRPTPFSTTPTPPGGPKKWTNLPEEDQDKDDEKK